MIKTSYDFDLTPLNTFAMQVKCKCFMEYNLPEDIPEMLASIPDGECYFHIGAGSNLLFMSDFPGVILHSAIMGREVIEESADKISIKVGAGETMDDFIRWSCESGFWGLENLSGIPGEVGSSAVQNVGAYGVEAGDLITKVYTYDTVTKQFVTVEKADCKFGYRLSLFKQPNFKGRYIITAVEYQLYKLYNAQISYPALAKNIARISTEQLTPKTLRDEIIKIRDSKLPNPSKTPSAGSFFKNPIVTNEQFNHVVDVNGSSNFPHFLLEEGYKIPAAWLIEQCGWKGVRKGNAAVWHLQPLVIVNPDKKASSDEIIALENDIINSVREKFGIILSPEVEHIRP
ncbi:MAG: UDP-N-acetylmuramate dehydrogenase [Muribaculum sp.]|nr:UDP-N-acetylmuramate dehydrogenase [Muribaculum sp.]